jgi:hypothetical protein
MRWLEGYESFRMYKNNTRPMLSEGNRLKQVAFSKHVRNRWGLPGGTKILWTMSDEKWWWGLVARTFAKLCPELGADKSSFIVHHKEHITKVMGHATVGYLFTDDVEAGGEGYYIGLHRCESFRVCLKKTYETERDPTTNAVHHRNKIAKYDKGDLRRVLANVTGSSTGTPTEPKLPLVILWEVVLLPALDMMVAPNGPCAGATVVHQEDNAGPHKEGNYAAWLQAQFDETDGNWNCRHPNAHIRMYWTCNCSLVCQKDIPNYSSCTATLKPLTTRFGRLLWPFGTLFRPQ